MFVTMVPWCDFARAKDNFWLGVEPDMVMCEYSGPAGCVVGLWVGGVATLFMDICHTWYFRLVANAWGPVRLASCAVDWPGRVVPPLGWLLGHPCVTVLGCTQVLQWGGCLVSSFGRETIWCSTGCTCMLAYQVGQMYGCSLITVEWAHVYVHPMWCPILCDGLTWDWSYHMDGHQFGLAYGQATDYLLLPLCMSPPVP